MISAHGKTVVAIVTNDSIKSLGLKEGGKSQPGQDGRFGSLFKQLSHVVLTRYNLVDITLRKRDATAGEIARQPAQILELEDLQEVLQERSKTSRFVPGRTIWRIRYNVEVITLSRQNG